MGKYKLMGLTVGFPEESQGLLIREHAELSSPTLNPQILSLKTKTNPKHYHKKKKRAMHTSITHKPHHQNNPAAEGKRLSN